MKTWMLTALALASQAAWAGTVALKPSFSVPMLDDAGLVVLALAVGGVAGWAVRRRGRK